MPWGALQAAPNVPFLQFLRDFYIPPRSSNGPWGFLLAPRPPQAGLLSLRAPGHRQPVPDRPPGPA